MKKILPLIIGISGIGLVYSLFYKKEKIEPEKNKFRKLNELDNDLHNRILKLDTVIKESEKKLYNQTREVLKIVSEDNTYFKLEYKDNKYSTKQITRSELIDLLTNENKINKYESFLLIVSGKYTTYEQQPNIAHIYEILNMQVSDTWSLDIAGVLRNEDYSIPHWRINIKDVTIAEFIEMVKE